MYASIRVFIRLSLTLHEEVKFDAVTPDRVKAALAGIGKGSSAVQ